MFFIKLTNSENNYGHTENRKLNLLLVFDIRKSHQYTFGHHFTLIMYCNYEYLWFTWKEQNSLLIFSGNKTPKQNGILPDTMLHIMLSESTVKPNKM